MTYIPPLLHAPGPRLAWRGLLALLLVVVCYFAFAPRPPGLHFDNADKLQHIAAFICLSVCAALSLQPGHSRLLSAGLAMLAVGLLIEGVQFYIPERSADWQDVVADAVGIAAGLATVAWARRYWRPATAPRQGSAGG